MDELAERRNRKRYTETVTFVTDGPRGRLEMTVAATPDGELSPEAQEEIQEWLRENPTEG